jgi:2-dehydro-3-deoxyphosphogluconate aldolase/(4S)-4-hydroxy-2-oxoglutarate aldolase
MATGGITVENTAEWLAAGAFTVSIGNDIRGHAARLRALLDG